MLRPLGRLRLLLGVSSANQRQQREDRQQAETPSHIFTSRRTRAGLLSHYILALETPSPRETAGLWIETG